MAKMYNAILSETLRDVHAARSSRAHCSNAVVCSAESHGYENEYLITHIQTIKTHRTMNKELETGLGKRVYEEMCKKGIYDAFCASLLNALTASASETCGVGRTTYAALVRAWANDTLGGAYDCNESLARKLLAADGHDARVRRIGVAGHYAYYVAPRALSDDDAETLQQTDNIRTLIASYLRSWQRWYDAVVRWGHYADDTESLCSCVSRALLARCRALWSWRGTGGRRAMTTAERAQRTVSQSASALSPEQLRAALTAAGVDLTQLLASE